MKTGLSDQHIIYTIFKPKFEKFGPKKWIYCNFKQYDREQLKLDICNSMSPIRTDGAFEKTLIPFWVNMLLRKQKFYEGTENPILIRTFGRK